MKAFIVDVSDDARRDMDEAEIWLLENASVRAASTVLDAFADCLVRLATDALMGTPRPEYGVATRFLVARPYLFYYDVADDRVTVLRVLHQARDRDTIMRGVQEEVAQFEAFT